MFEFTPTKTIRFILYYFFTACFIGLLLHFLLISDTDYTIEFEIFVILFTTIHGVIGLGILIRKRWGFWLFQWYLSMLYIAFPIGTYLSFKIKKHINKINLQKYFTDSRE